MECVHKDYPIECTPEVRLIIYVYREEREREVGRERDRTRDTVGRADSAGHHSSV
jgi:hypothetical protein